MVSREGTITDEASIAEMHNPLQEIDAAIRKSRDKNTSTTNLKT